MGKYGVRCSCYNKHNSSSGRCHHSVEKDRDYCNECVAECGVVEDAPSIVCPHCEHPIDAHQPMCLVMIDAGEACGCRKVSVSDRCPSCSTGKTLMGVCDVCRGSGNVAVAGVEYSEKEYGECPECHIKAFLKEGGYCFICDAEMSAMAREADGEDDGIA